MSQKRSLTLKAWECFCPACPPTRAYYNLGGNGEVRGKKVNNYENQENIALPGIRITAISKAVN